MEIGIGDVTLCRKGFALPDTFIADVWGIFIGTSDDVLKFIRGFAAEATDNRFFGGVLFIHMAMINLQAP